MVNYVLGELSIGARRDSMWGDVLHSTNSTIGVLIRLSDVAFVGVLEYCWKFA